VEPCPSRAEFREIAGRAPVVPVWRELLGDADTPVAAFTRLRGVADTRFLLESVVGGQRWARYSFLGVGHRAHLRGDLGAGGLAVEVKAGDGFRLPPALGSGSGIAAIREVIDSYRGLSLPDLPRFWGGLVGVCGHDLVRCFERLPAPKGRPESGLPAVELLLSDTVVVFDNLSQTIKLVATACPETDGGVDAAYDAALARIERVRRALQDPAGPRPAPLDLVEDAGFEAVPTPPWSRAEHLRAVQTAREHIIAGDIFQVVLSQRFDQPRGDLDPLDVYRVLRVTNPSPYMYLLELPSATLVGASPEVLVRVDRDTRRITVRPIAGTRPRGDDETEDRRLEAELLADPKERAEHLMLIDLGRNDVGRVAAPGTVRMEESFEIERYSRVMHIVSEVSGELLPQIDSLDALRATFPAGTLSGAPKVRALEIVDELESAERGWYGGAVGYLGYDGGADFAICIRSLVVHQDTVSVQAGGGIVFDSIPEAEDEECRNKAAAVLRAVAMARAGRAP
jgi:anthranilate synthase component 1